MRILSWLIDTQKLLLRRGHRAMIVLDGQLSWAEQLFCEYTQALSRESVDFQSLIYKDNNQSSSALNRKTYSHVLGTESNAVLFVDDTFSIDALTALSGTLTKGGLLFVWLDKQKHTEKSSAFIQRFLHGTEQAQSNWVIEQNKELLPPARDNAESHSSAEALSEQATLVNEIVKNTTSKQNHPMVITADRGRGKSSALGIAVAQLLSDSTMHANIVITAPNRASLNVFYAQLTSHLPEQERYLIRNGRVSIESCSLQFLPVDEAVKADLNDHILVVDEAAGVPVYLLTKLLSQYKQCIFSSTVYGYEGAGKGFTLKFLPWVAEQFPHYKQYHLKQPIRWNQNDPLEQLLFNTCLLNAEIKQLSSDDCLQIRDCETIVKKVPQYELAKNELMLRDVFSILVTAHYQTKPSDLKILLDNPHVHIFIALKNNIVTGVALNISEGDIEPELIEAVKQGRRRLKNQFLPQSILTQCQQEQAFDYQYLRVMRIAVHPQLQNRGIGGQLLAEIEMWAKSENIGCFGTSFAANPNVCKFWFDAQFKPVRIGFTPDASSGEHSMLMLKSLDKNSESFVDELTSRFYESFDYLLVDEYQALSVELVHLVLRKNSLFMKQSTVLSEHDYNNVVAFSEGFTQYSYVVLSLHRWLLHYLAQEQTQDKALEPMIAKLLMKQSIADICKQYSFLGKKAFNQFLRTTIAEKMSEPLEQSKS